MYNELKVDERCTKLSELILTTSTTFLIQQNRSEIVPVYVGKGKFYFE